MILLLSECTETVTSIKKIQGFSLPQSGSSDAKAATWQLHAGNLSLIIQAVHNLYILSLIYQLQAP